MIDLLTARKMAGEALVLLRDDGWLTPSIVARLEALWPASNGFERRRAVIRAVALKNLQARIRLGIPPVTMSVPFPLPPSSGVGGANPLSITVTLAIAEPLMPVKHRNIVWNGLSGDAYESFAQHVDEMLLLYALIYPMAEVTVGDLCRHIF